MYIQDSQDYKYHLKHYGHPSQVGYKDIADRWKAENFDPDALMQMYKTSDTVIQQLVDVVSKNSVYLLSIPLKADGTINKKEKKIVDGIGR